MASGSGYSFGFNQPPQATYGFAGYRAGGARPMGGTSAPYVLSYPGMSGKAPSGQRPTYGGRNMTLGSDSRGPAPMAGMTNSTGLGQSQQPVMAPLPMNSQFTQAPIQQVTHTAPSPYQPPPAPAPQQQAAPQTPWFAPQVEAMQKIISAFSAPAQFDRQLYRRGQSFD